MSVSKDMWYAVVDGDSWWYAVVDDDSWWYAIIIIIIIASARSFIIQLWETCISQQRYHDDEPFGYSSTEEWWTQPSLFIDSIIATYFSFNSTKF